MRPEGRRAWARTPLSSFSHPESFGSAAAGGAPARAAARGAAPAARRPAGSPQVRGGGRREARREGSASRRPAGRPPARATTPPSAPELIGEAGRVGSGKGCGSRFSLPRFAQPAVRSEIRDPDPFGVSAERLGRAEGGFGVWEIELQPAAKREPLGAERRGASTPPGPAPRWCHRAGPGLGGLQPPSALRAPYRRGRTRGAPTALPEPRPAAAGRRRSTGSPRSTPGSRE